MRNKLVFEGFFTNPSSLYAQAQLYYTYYQRASIPTNESHISLPIFQHKWEPL